MKGSFKMKNQMFFTTIAFCACCSLGCVTREKEKGTVYVDSDVRLKGEAAQLTQSDYDNAVVHLLNQMLTDAAFKKAYDRRKNELPVLVSGSIRNEIVGERHTQRLKSMEETLFRALRKAGLFNVKYDEQMGALANRIKANANHGLEDGALLKSVGSHASPDYYLTGALRRYVDEGVYSHELTLELHDLNTGIALWTERAVIRKKEVR